MEKPHTEGGSKLPRSTVAKISRELREFVTEQAKWNESIDATLRRLLGKKFRTWLDGRNGKKGSRS